MANLERWGGGGEEEKKRDEVEKKIENGAGWPGKVRLAGRK